MGIFFFCVFYYYCYSYLLSILFIISVFYYLNYMLSALFVLSVLEAPNTKTNSLNVNRENSKVFCLCFFFLTYILGSLSWSWEQCWWMWLWKWTDVISVILMSRQNDPVSILCSPWYEMIMNWFLSRWISRTLPLSEIFLSCSHFPTQKEIIRKMSAVYNTQIMSYISVLPCNCCLDLYFLWHVLNGYICLQWEQN